VEKEERRVEGQRCAFCMGGWAGKACCAMYARHNNPRASLTMAAVNQRASARGALVCQQADGTTSWCVSVIVMYGPAAVRRWKAIAACRPHKQVWGGGGRVVAGPGGWSAVSQCPRAEPELHANVPGNNPAGQEQPV